MRIGSIQAEAMTDYHVKVRHGWLEMHSSRSGLIASVPIGDLPVLQFTRGTGEFLAEFDMEETLKFFKLIEFIIAQKGK